MLRSLRATPLIMLKVGQSTDLNHSSISYNTLLLSISEFNINSSQAKCTLNVCFSYLMIV